MSLLSFPLPGGWGQRGLRDRGGSQGRVCSPQHHRGTPGRAERLRVADVQPGVPSVGGDSWGGRCGGYGAGRGLPRAVAVVPCSPGSATRSARVRDVR